MSTLNSKKNLNDSDDAVNKKKSFNKKKWRDLKYNNKAKVLKWENIKKKQALKKYNKKFQKLGFNSNNSEQNNKNIEQKSDSLLRKAQLKYNQIQEEKHRKKMEKELDRQKREEALKAYKEKKAMRYKKLFKNNRLKRPSMKGRLELMLEKIQEQYGNKS